MQKYTVLIPFKFRGHWQEKGQSLNLLPCEATALKNGGFIQAVIEKPAKKGTDNAA
uniref:Uncharacterized protein n=1 Tax=viral metagenome TaxID=1070528 RepID=A0A6M3KMN4_9ZZZZ